MLIIAPKKAEDTYIAVFYITDDVPEYLHCEERQVIKEDWEKGVWKEKTNKE